MRPLKVAKSCNSSALENKKISVRMTLIMTNQFSSGSDRERVTKTTQNNTPQNLPGTQHLMSCNYTFFMFQWGLSHVPCLIFGRSTPRPHEHIKFHPFLRFHPSPSLAATLCLCLLSQKWSREIQANPWSKVRTSSQRHGGVGCIPFLSSKNRWWCPVSTRIQTTKKTR